MRTLRYLEAPPSSRTALGRRLPVSWALLVALGGLPLWPSDAQSQPAQPPPAPAPPAAQPPAAAPPAAPPAGQPPAASPPAASPPAASPPAASPPAAAPPSAPPPAAPPAPAFVKKEVPPPPPPTPEQLAALAELQKEADAYEAAAKDYRSAITRIVQHHYEDKRRRILSALDREVEIEKKGLVDARIEAIRRLEIFVDRYSGVNAHPEATPDAMFRLAALYEERARADLEDNLLDADIEERIAEGLKPAIALYKRVIVEFPQYRELAGIYYYLGHALNESGRLLEAQQVWRSLVCHNKFPYPVEADPNDPEKDKIEPLPQDQDAKFWNDWRSRHTTPIGDKGSPTDDETAFVDPYPETCQEIAQDTPEGAEPRYIAEVWWRIGDHHFNEIDPAGGPYNYNRAESAYQRALKFKKPPVYGVALYKLAWTYFKQQRYETSVRSFVELLFHTDEQEKLTGDPGADFRSEAYTYIAGSLTYLDFAGPSAREPYIPRNDILDTERDPLKAEQKMRIAIERVQNPQLIPQDQKWTVEIYKALALEFKELNQYRNTIEVSDLILKKWPMDRDAPVVQNQIAETYETLARQSTEGTAEHREFSAKALEARSKLSAYVGNTPWVDANKDDPEAIQEAERLVRGGLRRAAADHTNQARKLVQEALAIGDKAERDPVFARALSEYRMAADAWRGYLEQDPNSPDAYESRFWHADALHKVVVVKVAMGESPTAADFEASRRAAIDVRDSNEDDKFLQPAAFMVVDTAHQALTDKYNLYERTSGAQGYPLRDGVQTTGEGTETKVIKDPLPPEVELSIKARDEYVQRVPPEKDTKKNSEQYAFDSADYYFKYGHFEEARRRFTPIYVQQCGVTPFGYKAWERLTTMSNLENNVEESRKLAQAALTKSCAVSEEQKVTEGDIARPTISRGYYIDAANAFDAAEKMPEGPEKAAAWRKAAALYKAALEKAPARDEAPEAAINGAFAYKQVGEYDEAIEMYGLFIKEYGSEENLNRLEKGDNTQKPPVAPDPKKYGERVQYLKQAYDSLSSAYVLFFNYRTAAETYDTISRNKRFDEAHRREAARNAVILYANIGEDAKMLAARDTLYALKPPNKQKVEIDYLVASADLKRWDDKSPDTGPNKNARLKAIQSMERYFNSNRNDGDAAPFVVQAAYHAAKMRKAGSDPRHTDWCKNTIGAFDRFKGGAPVENNRSTALGSLQADMAAECEFSAIDAKLEAVWDGKFSYKGVIDKVTQEYDKDLGSAESHFNELQAMITKYESRAWSVAARARQGSLYDAPRTALYKAVPPAINLYTAKEEQLLKLAETSDREDLQEQADAIRQNRREQWRAAKEKRLDDADRAMIKFYAESVIWAKAWKVRNHWVDHAIQRLAFFTDIIGDAKIRQFTQGIQDPETKSAFVYTDKYFLRSRPGQTPSLKADGLPVPLPVTP